MMFVLFFVNDTATTEINTYCHTLSLPDALPISDRRGDQRALVARGVEPDPVGVLGAERLEHGAEVRQRPRREVVALRGVHVELVERLERSEEHTSELQSLMRISYAVFCLKKKKKTDQKRINKKKSETEKK